jgi:type IV pilus secretin PilQ/predicted competence protein
MTVTKGRALLLAVTLAGALVNIAGSAETRGSTTARLTAISSRLNGKGASLVIEASTPVPYVATRPDPLTVLVDFRNVLAEGLGNSFASSAKGPIASVAVEPTESMGAPTSRVRVTLAQPVAFRVRSERNTIVVDFEKPSGKATPYVMAPASRQNAPDAMKALEQQSNAAQPLVATPAVDPIAALGLDKAPPAATLPNATVPNAASVPRTVAPVPQQNAAPQPPAPAPAPEQIGTQRGGQRIYTGHPVSFDFQGADLRAVLRTFAEISGLNIVIDPAVQGTVDVSLHDVPWDQALDIILRANKLGYIVDGTIVRIAPLGVLADEETQKRKLSDEQALAGELRVFTRRLSYAKAEELQGLLTKSTLSSRGTVQVDPRTNTIIVTDLADRLTMASDLIGTLDQAQPQVEIEARIVQTNKNYARALGIQWGFTGKVDPNIGNTTGLAFPNNGSLGGRTGPTQGPTGITATTVPTAVGLGVVGASSAVGLSLGAINGAFNLDVALSALETSGNGRLLSTPRVTMQNNVEAEITQGVQIPIQTVANNTVTVSFKDAALTMKVTPQITSANTVIMKISVENASPDFSRAVNNLPPINTQRANTQVLVNDGQTTVIGGIYVSQEQAATDRTPGLGRIPLLKWLFKRESVNDQSTELLIFITPRIIRGS